MTGDPPWPDSWSGSHASVPKAIHFRSVASGPIAALEALEAADAFVRAADLAAAWPRLAILVEEVVLNLVDHGGAAAGDPIALAFAAHDDGIRISVEDGGRPFDLRGAAPAFDPERIGGAGLRLIERWARIEDYASSGGRNRLLMFLPLDRSA